MKKDKAKETKDASETSSLFTPIVHTSPGGFKYTETRWRDKPNYQCCHCNFTTLHKSKIEGHFTLAHTPQ